MSQNSVVTRDEASSTPLATVTSRGAVAAPVSPVSRSLPSRLSRRANQWVGTLSWRVGRTGRPGLVGLALMLASIVFFVSTQLPMTAELQSLRGQVAASQLGPTQTGLAHHDPAGAARLSLPERSDTNDVLRVLLQKAEEAQLTLDAAKYEMSSTKSGALLRYSVTFPVVGSYPQIRKFIDSSLKAVPAVALTDLAIERKSIADAEVEARIRMTIFSKVAP